MRQYIEAAFQSYSFVSWNKKISVLSLGSHNAFIFSGPSFSPAWNELRDAVSHLNRYYTALYNVNEGRHIHGRCNFRHGAKRSIVVQCRMSSKNHLKDTLIKRQFVSEHNIHVPSGLCCCTVVTVHSSLENEVRFCSKIKIEFPGIWNPLQCIPSVSSVRESVNCRENSRHCMNSVGIHVALWKLTAAAADACDCSVRRFLPNCNNARIR